MDLVKTTVPTRRSFAERMAEYGAIDRDFVVFESDIGYSTYSHIFGEKYPDRYFNMGIAEQNTFGCVAGMAVNGRTVVACGYGVFITMRAVELIRSFICYPNLDVKFLSSHGGMTPAIDGVTHQATEDIAYMSTLPNMKVLVPACPGSAAGMFDLAIQTPGPVFTRLMRDGLYELYPADSEFVLGGSTVLKKGSDLTIISYGDIVFEALKAADELEKKGISAEVIDCYSIKPFDRHTVLESAKKTGRVLVAENHQARNGFAYEVATFLLKEHPVPFDNLGLDDTFAETGDYPSLLEKYGLSYAHIMEKAQRLMGDNQ